MFRPVAATAALLALLSAPAWANHCPADMKAIDEAMSSRTNLDASSRDLVAKLRAEGEALHKAGKHRESVEALGKARKLLGI